MIYLLIKWLHVLLAIVAVGANVTYGFWLSRASRNPDTLPFTLRGVKWIDDRIANPCYVLLLITGVILTLSGSLPWTTPWLLSALVLYVVVAVIALIGYSPTLRRQVELVEREGADAPDYGVVAARGRRLGMVLGILAVAIVFLMTVKPALWG